MPLRRMRRTTPPMGCRRGCRRAGAMTCCRDRTGAGPWRHHIEPKFGRVAIASITEAQVSTWVGGLVAGGLSTSTTNRYLSTLRSLLAFAVADGRIHRNAAATVKLPSGGRARREGQFLTSEELDAFVKACHGRYAELVAVLGLCGLRWGELAGLQVGDRVALPGAGLRLQRTVLASSHDGSLYIDSLRAGDLGRCHSLRLSFPSSTAGRPGRSRSTGSSALPKAAR